MGSQGYETDVLRRKVSRLSRPFAGTFVYVSSCSSFCASAIVICISTVQEIEAAIPKLSRAEVEKLHAWIEDFLEDHAELSDTAKARIEESRREIAQGNFTTRQPS